MSNRPDIIHRSAFRTIRGVSTEITVLELVKGDERYVFRFDDANQTEILRQLGKSAAHPELSFTWYDAALMSQEIRQIAPAEEDLRLDLWSRFQRPPA